MPSSMGVRRPTSRFRRFVSRYRIFSIICAIAVVCVAFFIAKGILFSGQGETSDRSSVIDVALTSVLDTDAEVQAAEEARRAAEEARTRTGAEPGVGIEDPWVDTGWFTTGDAELDQWIKDLCKDDDPSLSAWENAYKTYPKIAWAEYVERDNNQEPIGDNWRIEYAKQFFGSGYSGNCYEFAAAVQYMLQYYGYADAHSEAVLVERQSGSMGDHGLCFVTNLQDGRACFVDTSLGLNGWMLDEDTYNYRLNDFSQQSS